jgi:hypothetical protein
MREKIAFDIVKMSEETGIPVVEIRSVLNLVHSATTAQEAGVAYDNAPRGSEAKRLAMEKWLTFATTAQEAQEAYNNAPGGSEAERLAMEKWEDLSKNEVASATTAKEAREAYENAPKNSEAERLAMEKLASFYGWEKA